MARRSSDSNDVATYFHLHDRILSAHSEGDYNAAIRYSKQAIPLFPALVRETMREYGSFDIKESVAVAKGGKLMAAFGDRAGLETMLATLTAVPELHPWAETSRALLADLEFGETLLLAVGGSPGIRQLDLKQRLGSQDGARIANIVYWLAKVGRVRREKDARSYRLYLP